MSYPQFLVAIIAMHKAVMHSFDVNAPCNRNYAYWKEGEMVNSLFEMHQQGVMVVEFITLDILVPRGCTPFGEHQES